MTRLKQSKRQGRDRGREERKRAAETGSTGEGRCPSCRATLAANARFCHRCGVAMDGEPAGRGWLTPTLVLYAIIGLAVIVAGVGIALMSGGNSPVAPPPPVASAPTAGAGQPVDLSAISPREAADRLFNRVMMASEQGDMEEALRFAPKAIQAYGRVDRLDADAHYHMGLVYSVMGDFDNVRDQVSVIKQYAPNHLLGLILEHDVAAQEGNAPAAARAAAAFAEAYDAEIVAGRPEYDAHRNTIEAFRADKAGQ